MRTVSNRHEQAQATSVIDDRTLRGQPQHVIAAVQTVLKFDSLAGHTTNPKKLAALVTSKEAKTVINSNPSRRRDHPHSTTRCTSRRGQHDRPQRSSQRACQSQSERSCYCN